MADSHEDALAEVAARIDKEKAEREEAVEREKAERQDLKQDLEKRIDRAAGGWTHQ